MSTINLKTGTVVTKSGAVPFVELHDEGGNGWIRLFVAGVQCDAKPSNVSTRRNMRQTYDDLIVRFESCDACLGAFHAVGSGPEQRLPR